MNNKITLKIASLTLIGLLAIPNVGLAQETFSRAEILARAPIYLRVEIGKRLLEEYDEEVEYNGTIEALHGTITVAKEILIDSDETLTNAEKDTGVPSKKISFDFKTPFFKGLILKVQPDANYPEGGFENQGQLIFSLKNAQDEMEEELRLPFSELNPSFNTAAGEFLVGSVDFSGSANLSARNASFQKKLLVAERLMRVSKWARNMYLAGKIDADLYNKFELMAEYAWVDEYDDTEYFVQRYNRLKTNFNNGNSTPALFYGGLSWLMKKVAQ